ncbi:hypothetical protein SNE40_017208 [Patella caerulea]|uniref:CST complex subunit TEN1 n=1 Tax=Patella caerulea TaxID=87958 RepID=A0AAN8JBJ7_PATCE
MDNRSIPPCGKVLFIEEIHEIISMANSSVDGKSVRVTGRLERHNTESSTAVLVDPRSNKSLLIDTRLIEPFPEKLGSLFQFIGELEGVDRSLDVTLRARVVRCVDGLDLALYNQAIKAQREFLKQDINS